MLAMKIWRLAFVAWFVCAALTQAADRQIAFERNDAIWIANLDGGRAKRIAAGIFPAISPDGKRIAFTTVEKSGTTYIRHIAVVDLVRQSDGLVRWRAGGKPTVFKDVPSENAYYPSWSPDGKRILFTLRNKDIWGLGVINADGKEFRVVKKGASDKVTFYSPCWARDGQSIFCQNMTNIYRLKLDGGVLDRWNIEKTIPNGDMSGDGRIDVSPDGRLLLLSIDMAEENNRKDWDGPPPALWTFEIATQKAVRVTQKNLFAWDGCWINDQNVLFLSQAAGQKTASIYRMSIKRANLKRLIPNARKVTVNTRDVVERPLVARSLKERRFSNRRSKMRRSRERRSLITRFEEFLLHGSVPP
jgi:TolB protein